MEGRGNLIKPIIRSQSLVNFHLEVDNEVLSKMVAGRNMAGELVWECTECNYSHKKKTNLFRHVEAKHVSCAYFCSVCNASLTCRKSLNQHMKLKHSNSGHIDHLSSYYWNPRQVAEDVHLCCQAVTDFWKTLLWRQRSLRKWYQSPTMPVWDCGNVLSVITKWRTPMI